MKNIKNVISIILILLISCFIGFGCSKKDKSNNDNNSCAISPMFCKISFDDREFDIEDAEVKIYFGCDINPVGSEDNISDCYIYFYNYDTNEEIFVKKIENFIVEKYRCFVKRNEDFTQVIDIQFNYSEVFKIPSTLFTNSSSNIGMSFVVKERAVVNNFAAYCRFSYEIKNGKVKIGEEIKKEH